MLTGDLPLVCRLTRVCRLLPAACRRHRLTSCLLPDRRPLLDTARPATRAAPEQSRIPHARSL